MFNVYKDTQQNLTQPTTFSCYLLMVGCSAAYVFKLHCMVMSVCSLIISEFVNPLSV